MSFHLSEIACLSKKARESWLKKGDRNTKFFNRSIAKRRGKKDIKSIMWEGQMLKEPVEIKRAAKEYFKRISIKITPSQS